MSTVFDDFNNSKLGIRETKQSLIYHYTNAHALDSILGDNRLRFTKGNFLNDSSELKYAYSVYSGVVQERCSVVSKELERGLIGGWEAIIADNYDFFVLSLSENRDSWPLWSMYSKLNGYNIGFNYKSLKNNIANLLKSPVSFHSGRVEYKKHIQERIVIREIEQAEKLVYDHKIDITEVMVALGVRLIVYSLFFKNELYEHENEYRIIIGTERLTLPRPQKSKEFIASTDEVELGVTVSNEVFVPYLELDLSCKNGPHKDRLPIDIVTIGPKHDPGLAKTGLEYERQIKNHEFQIKQSHIPVNRAL